ncbi:MAG: hypothetical protein J0L94_17145 [Rhodothermia bacterium]|nr:hypothetical protein [Rhodothermia bacterium]
MKTKTFTSVLGIAGLALMFFGLLPTTVSAQNNRQEMRENRMELSWRLAADLQTTLTKEQKAQLFERMEQGKARMKAASSFGGPFMQGHRGKDKPNMTPLGPIGRVLTQEQKQTLMEKYRSEMPRNPMREANQRAMAEALKLSPSQQNQLVALRTETQNKIQALRQQGKPTDRNTNRNEMQRIAQDAEAAHERILTPQQLEIVKIHRAMAAGKKMEKANAQNQRMKRGGVRQPRAGAMPNRGRGFRGMGGGF